MSGVFFSSSSKLYNDLELAVKSYFDDKQLSIKGNATLYFKTVLFLSIALYCYVQVVFFTPVWWISLPLCALFGLNAAFIGFNIMHDGCHGSYSSKAWVNELTGLSLNLLGANSFFWKTKHNVAHHTYTNIDGWDSDIVQASFLRFTPTQPLRKIHRYQHLYGVFLYGMLSIAWVWANDFEKYFKGAVLNTKIRQFNTREQVVFWLTKLFYLAFYVVIPIWFVGFLPWLIGYFVMNFVLGLVLALVFQLAHVVDIVEFEDGREDDLHIEHEWAEHQLRTTANFATNNRVLSWFLGGLNFQVEHHLFPRISHVHYLALHQIVKAVCAEHGVVYHAYPSFSEALAAHFRTLRNLGQMETPPIRVIEAVA